MIVIKCPTCGRKVLWDDFQPVDIRCPGCDENLNVHSSLKCNIEQRELEPGVRINQCPRCNGIVSRVWFIKCPHCENWLFGPISFHGKWPFILAVITAYILFALYYIIYIH